MHGGVVTEEARGGSGQIVHSIGYAKGLTLKALESLRMFINCKVMCLDKFLQSFRQKRREWIGKGKIRDNRGYEAISIVLTRDGGGQN